MAPPGGVFPGIDALGTYHLLRPLATGGMARVWLAVDARDGRQVAVKRMLGTLAPDPELCRAFVDEGELGLRLRHPNIIETLEVGETSTVAGPGGAPGAGPGAAVEPYLVLELLRGRALIEVLRAAGRVHRPLPLGFVVRAVLDAARGLAHAHALADEHGHALGVVHRDVTPHNLFVCADGTVKVLDFGIAKAQTQRHQTRRGIIKGKFAYLSPEQIRGQPLDARADVWSLGIVLYELLTGGPLFRGSNEAETLHRILSFEIPAPESLRRDVPPGLGAIALRALQRDRDRRLPSAAALAESLEAVAAAEGIASRAASVKSFVDEIFPDDATGHAQDSALARRTYEHLSSAQLRALGTNPWMTPVAPFAAAVQPRPLLARIALGVGALVLTGAAALATATALSRHRAPLPRAPQPIAPLAAAATPAPSLELPAVTSPPVVTTRGARGSRGRRAHGDGTLQLVARPWAEVSVDGKVLGITPLPPLRLADGAHTVTFKFDQLGLTARRHVVISADRETLLVVDQAGNQTRTQTGKQSQRPRQR
jgi:serine/threonine-protein kinase